MIHHDNYKPKSVTYGFIGKDFPVNVHEYRKSESAEESKAKVLEAFGGRYKKLSILHQVHSGDAVIVNEVAEVIKADAQVTSNKEILLGIQTADCVPVIFVDEVNGVVGAAHAGWRSAIANIIDATIEKMKKLGANTDRIVAIVGPCIHQKDYEVGPEFLDQFMEESHDNGKFFIKSKTAGKYMFNLPGYVKHKLEKHGLSQIFDVDINTYDNDKTLFSYRKVCHQGNKLDGEILSVVGLL